MKPYFRDLGYIFTIFFPAYFLRLRLPRMRPWCMQTLTVMNGGSYCFWSPSSRLFFSPFFLGGDKKRPRTQAGPATVCPHPNTEVDSRMEHDPRGPWWHLYTVAWKGGSGNCWHCLAAVLHSWCRERSPFTWRRTKKQKPAPRGTLRTPLPGVTSSHQSQQFLSTF